MADFNPVPLGEAGTGAAFLLPGSTALQSANNYIDSQQAERDKQAKMAAMQAQKIAAQWKSNQLNIKGGTIFQPEINDRAQKITQMGMDLQRMGVDPTSYSHDPNIQKKLEEYQNERASLISDAETRDKIAEQAKQYEKDISSQSPGYYDQDSINAYHDFLSGKYGSLKDISAKGLQLPELKKAFNADEEINKLPVTHIETTGIKNGVKTTLLLPNDRANAITAHDFIQKDPQARAWAEKQIGTSLDKIPDSADPAKLKQELDQYWRSAPNIPRLAAMGITTFGGSSPEGSDPRFAVGQKDNQKYDQFITKQAQQLAATRQRYDDVVNGIKTQINAKVNQKNEQTWNFEYEKEMREREAHGMTRIRFEQWLKDQQQEQGEFKLGNGDTNVPIIKSDMDPATGKPKVDESGKQTGISTELEPGASLFHLRLSNPVDVTVQPSTVTSVDNKTGGYSYNNAEPFQMHVGGVKLVPVWKGDNSKDHNRNVELSARQLQKIYDGKAKASTSDIIWKPMVYGTKDDHDGTGHVSPKPVQIPYADFKTTNSKKINTQQFDQELQRVENLKNKPKFKALSSQDQLRFLAQLYQLKLQ